MEKALKMEDSQLFRGKLMKSAMRMFVTAGFIFGTSVMVAPSHASAQSVAQKVGITVKKAAKTTKHNVKAAGHVTKKAAKSTARATNNMVNGHKILCGDGTWASRDNPSCSGHNDVAKRQPGDRDKR